MSKSPLERSTEFFPLQSRTKEQHVEHAARTHVKEIKVGDDDVKRRTRNVTHCQGGNEYVARQTICMQQGFSCSGDGKCTQGRRDAGTHVRRHPHTQLTYRVTELN